MSRVLLTNGTVITPDQVIEGGSVLIEDGLIGEISERSYPADSGSVDLQGRWLMPGLICLHNDALENEIHPRPNANHDPDFAMLQLDRRLATAGITTQYHAVSFLEVEEGARSRSIDFAVTMCDAVERFRASGAGRVDHHILFRLEVRTPGALDALQSFLPRASNPLISIDDHVPGRGQLRDVEDFKAFLRSLGKFKTEEEIDAQIAWSVARIERTQSLVDDTFARIKAMQRDGDVRLLLKSHDDDSPERVDEMYEVGCRISEFPTTLAAAKRARELGMTIEMGAPNALRGRSLISNNASAMELYDLGLVDTFLADYYAPSMLAVLFRIASRPGTDLAAAARLFTLNPANSVGMADRGAIEVGRRADLIAVESVGQFPMVSESWIAGRPAYISGDPLVAGLAAQPAD